MLQCSNGDAGKQKVQVGMGGRGEGEREGEEGGGVQKKIHVKVCLNRFNASTDVTNSRAI